MHTTRAWDPQRYLDSPDPRTRPFHDLLGRIPELPGRPARIADLGCGTGVVTAVLAERWPDAHITGLDSCAESLRAAEARAGETAAGGRLEFQRADIGDWSPEEPYDLIVSSAALQWITDHAERFKDWTRALRPGGVLAFQVPDNAASAGHAALRALCASPRWRERLGTGVLPEHTVHDPADYLDRLAGLGLAVDAWETTYGHVLPADDPFAGWVTGTGMRPLLDALADDPGDAEEFLAEYRARLRETYPAAPYGTVFPFRRVFAVARRERAA
ncbi:MULTISPECIES: methyltransferase domain-containing protein [unclassified Streptomyces]|uniref:methyltransferase domain-containing protein n=1 Tax=unclassified Streptomyces TaxID=2593676 RepID=UPI00278C3326|nr:MULTISPECIES: methyltransferase domain-containing protein [unclassified Streptomyces]